MHLTPAEISSSPALSSSVRPYPSPLLVLSPTFSRLRAPSPQNHTSPLAVVAARPGQSHSLPSVRQAVCTLLDAGWNAAGIGQKACHAADDLAPARHQQAHGTACRTSAPNGAAPLVSASVVGWSGASAHRFLGWGEHPAGTIKLGGRQASGQVLGIASAASSRPMARGSIRQAARRPWPPPPLACRRRRRRRPACRSARASLARTLPWPLPQQGSQSCLATSPPAPSGWAA